MQLVSEYGLVDWMDWWVIKECEQRLYPGKQRQTQCHQAGLGARPCPWSTAGLEATPCPRWTAGLEAAPRPRCTACGPPTVAIPEGQHYQLFGICKDLNSRPNYAQLPHLCQTQWGWTAAAALPAAPLHLQHAASWCPAPNPLAPPGAQAAHGNAHAHMYRAWGSRWGTRRCPLAAAVLLPHLNLLCPGPARPSGQRWTLELS
eukprot:1143635-Pelagomonas_calceolata.AAC.6